MTTLEEQLKRLNHTRLPDAARTRMRAELSSYAELHAVSAAAARPVRSPFSYFTFRLYASVAAVVVIVAGLGGTAYASENALPGDVLYPVKVGIAEPIQTALVPSDRGKAAWHAILAERRLEETADLAADGRLSPDAQGELAANFTTQVSASQESADRLERNGDTTGSLTVRSDLEARLSAHEQILSVLSAHFADATTTDAQETRDSLTRMLAVVTDHAKAVTSARIALEDAIAPNADDATSTAKIALAPRLGGHLRIHERATPSAQVETAAMVRTQEEDNILERHAALLAKFMPVATTTATSTATTTEENTEATTTEDGDLQNAGLDDSQQDTDAGADGDSENMNP